MRYVIFGAGAIGGTIGARLHQSGREVMLIARGAHHDAIASDGLRLRTPNEDVTLPIPVARTPRDAQLRAGDVVLLCVKSQDTRDAMHAIRAALPVDPDPAAPSLTVPIVCVQNGVENEREALRHFPDVYAVIVMVPTEHLEPGIVISYGSKLTGRLDIGRYAGSVDALAQEISHDLGESQFESAPRAEIMVHKYAKLLQNLGNAVDAICGREDLASNGQLRELVRAEGSRIFDAAGIAHRVEDIANLGQRWRRIGTGEVDGHPHRGGSTWQSVTRELPSIETDFLNGEAVLTARLHGVPAPVNELLQELAARTVSEGRRPGWISAAAVLSHLAPSGR